MRKYLFFAQITSEVFWVTSSWPRKFCFTFFWIFSHRHYKTITFIYDLEVPLRRAKESVKALYLPKIITLVLLTLNLRQNSAQYSAHMFKSCCIASQVGAIKVMSSANRTHAINNMTAYALRAKYSHQIVYVDGKKNWGIKFHLA